MEKRTVVAWDGSGPAHRAVAWAVDRVRDHGDRLLIVRVVDDAHLYVDELEVQRGITLANFAVAELAARLRTENPEFDIDTLVAAGEPREVLAAFSGEDTLLVVGSEHGMTDDYWHSSRMGQRLAATAPGPVAIVPVEDGRARSGVVAAIDDPSSAGRIADMAADMAERLGEALLLVHALESGAGEAPDFEELGTESQTILDEVVDHVASTHPRLAVERHVSAESATRTILRLARDASHVVVGSRRPGTLRRLFLGSVSHAVVNNVHCPTIVVASDRVGTR